MYRNLVILFLSLLIICAAAQEIPLGTESTLPPQAIWLESLDLKYAQQDWGTPQIGKSINTNPIRLNGVTYPHGLGAHAYSSLMIQLNKSADRFESMVGLDDEIKEYGSVTFEVWVDNHLKVRTDIFKPGSKPQFIQVDLKKANLLTLMIKDGEDGINCDHADWAGARIYLAPGTVNKIKTIPIPMIQPPDIHFPVSDKPVIHGAKVVGTTPGHDFLYMIPATGEGPLVYTVINLPEGLLLDSTTGIITGKVKNAGTYPLQLKVSGPKETCTRKLTLIAGNHKLAQTPPMGWNAWNVWADTVNEAKMKSGADWMIKSGLAAHGYQYINIDDAWEKGRSTTGEITSNEKFPDMKALGDYIHQKGLRFGIYSSPGPKTCAGYEASYQHEFQDAKTFASWGVDYLKYDWCSYWGIAKNNSLPELQSPYRLMHQALEQSGRDIVYSLCQYGMGSSWQWGESVGGNLWRTGEDISDNWGSLSRIGFTQNGREKYAGPGHWNDPDMMIVGKVGVGIPVTFQPSDC